MSLTDLINSVQDPDFQALVTAHNYPAIANYLNYQQPLTEPNPEPRQTVPVPVDMVALRALLTPTEVAFFLRPRSINTWLADALENPNVTDNAPLLAIVDQLLPNATGEMPLLGALKTLVESGDRQALGALAAVLVQTGDISSESGQAIQNALSATIDDPDYQSEITVLSDSLAQQNGFGVVSNIDVQQALN